MPYVETGPELTVNSPSFGSNEAYPLTIGLANGGMVVLWQASDGDWFGDVRARIYDASGVPLGDPFTLLDNTTTVTLPRLVAAEALPNGNFAVVFFRVVSGDPIGGQIFSQELDLQIFSATGTALTGWIPVSSQGGGLLGHRTEPEIDVSGDRILVIWDNSQSAGTPIYARLFDFNGGSLSGPIEVEDGIRPISGGTASFGTDTPDIAFLSTGGFISVWADWRQTEGDTQDGAIRARLFNAAGVALGDSFLVNTTTAFNQAAPAVAALAGGGFVVTWGDMNWDDVLLLAQLFDSSGNKVGGEFTISSTVGVGGTFDYSLVALDSGGFAVAWSQDVGGQTHVREYDAAGTPLGAAIPVSSGSGVMVSIDDLANGAYAISWEASGVPIVVQRFAAVGTQDSRNDFNGDGRSDILWRNSDGTVSDWLANANATFASNHAVASYALDINWTVAGSGDFNGDGRDDLLLRHANGTVVDWLGQANGSFISNHAAATYALGTNWTVAGTGDFNGDGRDDILWRNEVGAMSQWLGQANGSFAYNASAAYQLPTNWEAAATGDFNGDGRQDILWRNEVGAMSQWLGQANGSFVYNPNAAYQLPTNWEAVASGDFNGDGRDDLLWRNEVGAMSQWLAQPGGTFAYNPNAAYQLATNWELASTGDFNGDGRDDLLWRNEVGAMSQWLANANGTFAYNPNAAYQLPTNWQVQPENMLL